MAAVILRRVALVATVVACSILSAACTAATPGAHGGTAAYPKLVVSYAPSQPTGWEQPYRQTLGGHVISKEATYGKVKYRVTLLGVVYESVPRESYVAFKKTLGQAWDSDYAFKYMGGLPTGAQFVVESNSAWLSKGNRFVSFGADVYVVYKPGRSRKDLPINSDLQFIQVIYTTAPVPEHFVDSMRHNPFYGEGAGLTSIYGNQIVNFYDDIHVPLVNRLSEQIVRAETFLVQDTGTKNSAGKDIVKIYGGLKWGLELKRVS